MKTNEARILDVIGLHGGLSPYAISRMTHISKKNIYTYLNKMVEKGYIFKLDGVYHVAKKEEKE